MLVCTKIRLQVGEADSAALEFMQGKRRGLATWWVMRLRGGERWPGWVEAKARLQSSKEQERGFVSGKLLQEVSFRLDKAMVAFVRQVKAGEIPGFLRVRPRPTVFTRCSPAMYVKVGGDHVTRPTGGGGASGVATRFPNSTAHLTQAPPPGCREVAISRDARGNADAANADAANADAAFVAERPAEAPRMGEGVVAFDLGITTLTTGVRAQGRVYHRGGYKGHRCATRHLDKLRSKRDRGTKQSRRSIHRSQPIHRSQRSQRVSERPRAKQRDGLHRAAHLIAHRLVESTGVLGDLAQRPMGTTAQRQKNRQRNRAVFTTWGLYGFVQMLDYTSQHAGKEWPGKEWPRIEERYTSMHCSRCGSRQDRPHWKRSYRKRSYRKRSYRKRSYRCGTCGRGMARDEHGAVTLLQRFLARLGPHEGQPARCAVPQTPQTP